MQSLQDHFLIAMPNLADPFFSRTVSYICEHDDNGAMGFIINRTTQFVTRDLLKQLELESNNETNYRESFLNSPIHIGGPVQNESGFILHNNDCHWENTLQVSSNTALTSSHDVLTALANGTGPDEYLIILGFANWEAGQLEQEIIENAWLHGPADADTLFRTLLNNAGQVLPKIWV